MIKLEEFMDFKPVYILLPNNRDNVIEIMKKNALFYLPVVNEHTDKFEGTVSLWDVIAKINEFQLVGLMNKHPPYLFEDSSVREAANLMSRNRLNILPVIDHEKRLVGTISALNLLPLVVNLDSKIHIMHYARNPTFPLYENTPLSPALISMYLARTTASPVIDYRAHLTGLVTALDIFKHAFFEIHKVVSDIPLGDDEDTYPWEAQQDSFNLNYEIFDIHFPDLQVYQIMDNRPTIVRTYAGISETASLFLKKEVNQFPILDVSDHLAGLVFDLDLLLAILEL